MAPARRLVLPSGVTVTHPSRPWNDVAFGPVPVPTMITREEQRYLYWLPSTQWTGEGVVVEMGPWLGGSTLCLAAGIRDSAHARRFSTPLHVIDDFVWREFMAGAGRPDLAPGASFEANFRENLREHEGLLAVHRGSLPDDPRPDDPDPHAVHDVAAPAARNVGASKGSLLRWTTPEPVEILFVDGAKSWEGMRHLLAEVGPHLLPGTSLLVCQDYKYQGAYWVPLVLELLSHRLELIHVLERNTVTFRLTAPLSAEDVRAVGSLAELDPERGVTLLEAAAARLRGGGDRLGVHEDRLGAAILGAATARLLAHKGLSDAARRAFRDAERAWPLGDAGRAQLERARAWLEARLDEGLPPSARTRLRRAFHPVLRRLPLP